MAAILLVGQRGIPAHSPHINAVKRLIRAIKQPMLVEAVYEKVEGRSVRLFSTFASGPHSGRKTRSPRWMVCGGPAKVV